MYKPDQQKEFRQKYKPVAVETTPYKVAMMVYADFLPLLSNLQQIHTPVQPCRLPSK